MRRRNNLLRPLRNKGLSDKMSNVLRFFLRVQHASGFAKDLDDLQRGSAADGLRDIRPVGEGGRATGSKWISCSSCMSLTGSVVLELGSSLPMSKLSLERRFVRD